MTTQTSCPRDLSDRDLLAELQSAAASERQATARLIALLMEVDSRKLYAGQGCSSLFTYCVQVLHLSEHAAYLRIEVARLARRLPPILERLSDGSLHLTAVSLLGPHLTAANHVELFNAATHKSKREVEQLIARLRPQPDVPSVVRKLPRIAAPLTLQAPRDVEATTHAVLSPPAITFLAPTRPPEIKPLAPERYKVQFTVSQDTHEKFRRVQDLMRHIVPNGDPAVIFDRALTLLLADLLKAKCGAAQRPRHSRAAQPRSRHIPAAVKREVWRRDGGRCAFHGEQGRCCETGLLEFHHVVPYADGGEASAGNIELRCRAHNEYEAVLWSGAERPLFARETASTFDA
jgi:hypothetical protein